MKNLSSLIIILSFFLFSCHHEDKTVLKNWNILGPFPFNEDEYNMNRDFLSEFGFSENNINYLTFCDLSENNLKTNYHLDNRFINSTFFSAENVVNINELIGLTKETAITACAYLGCIIKSKTTKTVWLNFASDNGAKIWLNHELIFFKDDKTRKIANYQNYFKIKLKKGNNFLLIKVSNYLIDWDRRWEIFARLEKFSKKGLDSYYNTQLFRYNNDYLNKGLYSSDDTIVFNDYADDYLPVTGKIITFQHSDSSIRRDTVKHSGNWQLYTRKLKEGFYNVKLPLKKDTLTQIIYIGDIVKYTDNLISGLGNVKIDSSDRIILDANIFRYHHLLNYFGNYVADFFDPKGISKKLVSICKEIELLHHNLVFSKPAFEHQSGVHIMAFYSEIDHSVQHYLLHIPEGYSQNNPVALFIGMPVDLTVEFPYLQSWRLANVELNNAFLAASNKYNIAVLQPQSRTTYNANFNDIEETDLFEAFSDVKKHFNIDTNRLYIAGSCSGGYRALYEAVKHPSMFAALCLVSPMIDRPYQNIPWLNSNQPLNFVENIKHLPIFLYHSVKDPHWPVEVSDAFYQQNFKNLDITYFRYEDEIQEFYYEDYLMDIFHTLKDYKRKLNTDNISFSTNQLKYNNSFWLEISALQQMNQTGKMEADINRNTLNITSQNVSQYSVNTELLPFNKRKPLLVFENGKQVYSSIVNNKILSINHVDTVFSGIPKNSTTEGPLQHVFTSRFIIVKGTVGTARQSKIIGNVADTLNAYWMKRYKCSAIIKKDVSVTNEDIQSSNLVLLGNNKTNLIIQKIYSKIPLKFETDKIILGTKNFSGHDLGIYMVYPNPLNLKKYIAIIGSNAYETLSSGGDDLYEYTLKDISAYGFYDFKIWKNLKSGYFTTIDKGYFDLTWK